MAALFGRRVIVNVGGDVVIDGLEVEFSIKKSVKPEPNESEIRIFNLSDEKHQLVASNAGIGLVKLSAGYAGKVSDIFIGDIISVHRERSVGSGDIITVLMCGDGDKAQGKKLRKSYAKGTKFSSVIEDLAKSLDIGIGNVKEALAVRESTGLPDVFKNGTVISGYATDIITKLLSSRGAEWSIQDNNIQITALGRPVSTQIAVRLSNDTGLVGSPNVKKNFPEKGSGESKKRNNEVSCQSLIIPGLVPGAKVLLESEYVNGLFRIEEVTYSGSLFGTDFYADMALGEIKEE